MYSRMLTGGNALGVMSIFHSRVGDLCVIKLKVTEDGYPKTGVQPFSGDPGDDSKKYS